jgi:GAF domain-containing protein
MTASDHRVHPMPRPGRHLPLWCCPRRSRPGCRSSWRPCDRSAPGLELHGTLDRICRTAAGLADARYAAIGVLDAQGQGLSGFVTCGVDEEVARRIGHRPDGRRGLLGALVREPSPVRLTDLTTDPRATGSPPGHPPMRSFIGVPVRVEGEVFGNLKACA